MRRLAGLATLALIGACTQLNTARKDSINSYDDWFQREIFTKVLEEMMMSDSSAYNDRQTLYEVLHYINAECPKCVYELKDWGDFSSLYDANNDVKFTFVIYSHDFDAVGNIIKEIGFKRPVVYDNKNIYVKTNNIPDDFTFSTFLLDSSNRVLLIGNPIANPEVNSLYMQTLKKTTKLR